MNPIQSIKSYFEEFEEGIQEERNPLVKSAKMYVPIIMMAGATCLTGHLIDRYSTNVFVKCLGEGVYIGGKYGTYATTVASLLLTTLNCLESKLTRH